MKLSRLHVDVTKADIERAERNDSMKCAQYVIAFNAGTDELLISDDLAEIRREMVARGLVRLQRYEQDEAHIVEVWL